MYQAEKEEKAFEKLLILHNKNLAYQFVNWNVGF